MLRVVWIVTDTRPDAVLETRHSALHNPIQEKRNGALCYCFVPVNAKLVEVRTGWDEVYVGTSGRDKESPKLSRRDRRCWKSHELSPNPPTRSTAWQGFSSNSLV